MTATRGRLGTKLNPGRDLAEAMGMRLQTLVAHVQRGTVTPPVGHVPGKRQEFFWREGDTPALNLLGASAVVPASDEMGRLELKRGYYLTPCDTGNHLGRYDGVMSIGLCSQSAVDFYRVDQTVRIGYLDPVRRDIDLSTPTCFVGVTEGDRLIDHSGLDDAEKELLRDACMYRAEIGTSDGSSSMANPALMTMYTFHNDPVVTGVRCDSPVRGVRFTLQQVTAGMDTVSLHILDEVAQAKL